MKTSHPLFVPCPHCAAPPGAYCMTPSGRFTNFHARRYWIARVEAQRGEARDPELRPYKPATVTPIGNLNDLLQKVH